MNVLLVVFILLALASIPLTKSGVIPSKGFLEGTWWKRGLLYLLGFALQLYILFPFFTAVAWADSLQSKTPPFDQDLRLKAMVLVLCWLIVVLQYMYRLGYEAGKKAQAADA